MIDFVQPALAKIGRCYYWAVEDWSKWRQDEAADSRIEDGFSDTRDAAVEALAAVLDRIDPGAERYLRMRGAQDMANVHGESPEKGWNWTRATTAWGGPAWRLYQKHHARKTAGGSYNARSKLKAAWGAERDERESQHEKQAGTVTVEEGDILGLCGRGWTSSEIMMAFRAKAKIHHPDRGGDPQDFLRLCEAKDKALERATSSRRE